MYMIAHQAECVNGVAEALHPFLEKQVEAVTVLVIKEDVLFAVAAEDDVIKGAGVVNAWFASHVLPPEYPGVIVVDFFQKLFEIPGRIEIDVIVPPRIPVRPV
jgi:hypothetical protein